MNRTVTGLTMGVLIAFALGIGTSVALAHGGGPMMRGGTPSYGMGHMGMMGGSGMMHMGPGMMHMGPGMMHMGPGMMEMMRGPGMMGGMGMGRIWMLDLTKEQRANMHKLQDQVRKTNWDTMGKIMDESSKLRELFAADKPDPKKIGAVYGNIFDLRRQMIESKIDTHNRVDAVLTKEQREQLKQMKRGYGAGRGGHGMMSPGTGQGG
ncbi:MAG: Spy/CpxP family protein refolding chaperone [Acidiferrobacterales bacterium]